MAASWKGALFVAGLPVNITLHSRVKSRSKDSFKTLAPDGEPIRQVWIDSSGDQVARNATTKGLERSPGDYLPLTPDQVARIEKGGARSSVVEAQSFVPKDSLPFSLALANYEVEPDAKQPGSAKSVNQLWNALLSSGTACITTFTLRSRDSILAVWAEEGGLYAAALPFAAELETNVGIACERDEKQGELLAGMLAKAYGVVDFDHTAYESEYLARREQVIDEVLTGAPAPKEDAKVTATSPDVDLMSALASLDEAQQEVTKKAAKPRKKAAAKAKAKA